MHVLPSLTSPVMAVSVALWCAAAITAIVARSDRNDAARPLAVEASSVPKAVEDKPAIPEATSVHTITYRLTTTFEQRWLRVPLVPSPTPSILTEALKPAEAIDYAQAEEERSRHARVEARDICERYGMHKQYFTDRPHHLSWK